MIAEEERFQIISHISISMEHYPILYNLYQPIIGSKALSLYFTLINECELLKRINLDVTHLRMTKLLKCSLKDLEDSRNLLEGAGLLDVYINETNKIKYCYQLNLPLSLEKFLQNNLYNEMLSKVLGINDYERTKFVLAKKRCDLSQYNKATKSFNEVFNINNSNVIIENENNINLNTITNEEHNWILNDQIYEKKLKELKTFSSYQYLRILKGSPLQNSDFQLLEKLLYVYQLKTEVINCLLDFVYYKNNKLLVFSYVEKIASSLKQYNINDIYKTAEYLKTAYEQSKYKEFNKTQESTNSLNISKYNNSKDNNLKTTNKYISTWNQGVIPHWLKADLKKKT